MRNPPLFNDTKGFTLVELIVIIVLLGILSVIVAPRFQNTGGYAEYTYQSRLISSLRTMQQRAMNDTRPNYCFQVNIFTGVNSSFGPPALDYSDGNEAATCLTTIDTSEDAQYVVATTSEMDADNVQITSGGGSIAFNGLGCPNTGSGFCVNATRIELQADSTLAVCVESQGYIHACD